MIDWQYDISNFEIISAMVFAVLYGFYLFRTIKSAILLQSNFSLIFVKLIVRLLFFSLLLISILGPSFGESKKEIQSVGKDIFVLVDLSLSMNANDIQPTRLEKLKFELKKIIRSFNSDRIGIIIFSSEAFVQSPLTFDQNALNIFVETLHTGLVPNAGTDFAPPLKMAMNKLKNEDYSPTSAKSKIILLISDGEDFGEGTTSIAKEIADEDIRLFTLGIGTESGIKIRTKNGFLKDNQGSEIISKLNPSSLKKIANIADGEYFEINQNNNDLNRLINKINNIEGELRDSKQIDTTANKYYYFLLIAVSLLLMDTLISIKIINI